MLPLQIVQSGLYSSLHEILVDSGPLERLCWQDLTARQGARVAFDVKK